MDFTSCYARYVREVNRYLALVEEQPQLFEKYIQQRRGACEEFGQGLQTA